MMKSIKQFFTALQYVAFIGGPIVFMGGADQCANIDELVNLAVEAGMIVMMGQFFWLVQTSIKEEKTEK